MEKKEKKKEKKEREINAIKAETKARDTFVNGANNPRRGKQRLPHEEFAAVRGANSGLFNLSI